MLTTMPHRGQISKRAHTTGSSSSTSSNCLGGSSEPNLRLRKKKRRQCVNETVCRDQMVATVSVDQGMQLCGAGCRPRRGHDLWHLYGVTLQLVDDLNSAECDSVVLAVAPDRCAPELLLPYVQAAQQLDAQVFHEVVVLPCPQLPGRRLVLSPTGPLTPYDDVRSLGEAAGRGMRRAAQAGSCRPVLVLQPHVRFPYAEIVALLAALETLYVPLQMRELSPQKSQTLQTMSIYPAMQEKMTEVVTKAVALEKARGLARDIGGADPERMSPLKVAHHVSKAFSKSRSVTVRVVDDIATIKRQYPLMAAVARAANTVTRHRCCVIFLEYVPKEYKKTVMLVGKGVTYDTGGVDIKTNGAMVGMSRDKCGAAAIAGFVKACELMEPEIKVVAALGMARNSVGAESYVADELIKSRSGLVVRIGNTDAEGRLVMADLLAEMVERAANEKCPHVYTVATLTGHVIRTYGEGYTAAMDNHVAHAFRHATALQCSGAMIGDMVEVSVIRREDFAELRPRMLGDDVHHSRNEPSTQTSRGHQVPAAFLMRVSGLDCKNVPYTHLDVAGSAGLHKLPTAAPLLALAAHYDLMMFKSHDDYDR